MVSFLVVEPPNVSDTVLNMEVHVVEVEVVVEVEEEVDVEVEVGTGKLEGGGVSDE